MYVYIHIHRVGIFNNIRSESISELIHIIKVLSSLVYWQTRFITRVNQMIYIRVCICMCVCMYVYF